MNVIPLAAHDVSCVTQGLSVDGVTPLARRLSFPSDCRALHPAARLVCSMYRVLASEKPQILDDLALRTALVFKMLAHLTRTGRACRLNAELVHEATLAALWFGEHPHFITAPVNITAVLRRYRQFMDRCLQPAHPLVPVRPDDAPPRPEVWRSPDGQHVLQELIHPWHLVEETQALGHCVGRPRDDSPDGPISLTRDLPYWRMVATGKSRLFSLAGTAGPLCTLHVNLTLNLLAEAEGRDRQPLFRAPFFPVLLEAIFRLGLLVPGLRLEPTLRIRLDAGRRTNPTDAP